MRLGLLVLVFCPDSDWCQCQGFIYLLKAYLFSRLKVAPTHCEKKWGKKSLKNKSNQVGGLMGELLGVKFRIDHYFGGSSYIFTFHLLDSNPGHLTLSLCEPYNLFHSYQASRHIDFCLCCWASEKYCQPGGAHNLPGPQKTKQKRSDWPSYEGHMPMSSGRNQSWLITWAHRPLGLMTRPGNFLGQLIEAPSWLIFNHPFFFSFLAQIGLFGCFDVGDEILINFSCPGKSA